jgi:B9 domain-containing protein 2
MPYRRNLKQVVWNHPLDLSFATTSVEAWPHAYFEVWSQDEHGRNALAGYAQLALPSAPGTHANLEAVVWRPRGTWLDRLRAAFLGGGPQLADPEATVLRDARRFGQAGAFRTDTVGVLTLTVTVAVAGNLAAKGVRLQGAP